VIAQLAGTDTVVLQI